MMFGEKQDPEGPEKRQRLKTLQVTLQVVCAIPITTLQELKHIIFFIPHLKLIIFCYFIVDKCELLISGSGFSPTLHQRGIHRRVPVVEGIMLKSKSKQGQLSRMHMAIEVKSGGTSLFLSTKNLSGTFCKLL